MFPTQFYNPMVDDDENARFAQQKKAIRGAHLHYIDIKRKSTWRQILARLTGHPNHLKDLSQVREHKITTNYQPLGIRPIRIDCIVGSENRANDFDKNFLPVNNNIEERWVNIAELMLLHVTLPPVDLIKVNNYYFVRDGHHRISVARYFGQNFIDANVFEMVIESNDFEAQPGKAEATLEIKTQACPI